MVNNCSVIFDKDEEFGPISVLIIIILLASRDDNMIMYKDKNVQLREMMCEMSEEI